ncbi:MAG: carbohydrate-binding protein [Acidobacteriota bacterium]
MDRVVMNGGIAAEPYPVGVGEALHIQYSGMLSRSGADKVYLRAGYGSNDSWADVHDYEMMPTDNGWEADLKVHRGGRIHFCFRDRADNWDNNNGHNWNYPIDSSRFK